MAFRQLTFPPSSVMGNVIVELVMYLYVKENRIEDPVLIDCCVVWPVF